MTIAMIIVQSSVNAVAHRHRQPCHGMHQPELGCVAVQPPCIMLLPHIAFRFLAVFMYGRSTHSTSASVWSTVPSFTW